MNMPNEMILKGISVSYVADEDRLLLEILFDGSSIPLWITRRGAFRLIDIFNEQLGINALDSKGEKVLKKKAPIAFERDIAATKNPPRPGVIKLNLEEVRSGSARVGVLKTLQFTHLDAIPEKYQMNFVDTHDKAFQMKMNRELLLNFESLLLQQIEKAQW